MKKGIIIFFTSSIFLIGLIFFSLFSFNDKNLHVVVCDVGQGDAILIKTPSQAQILIDGGPDRSVLDCLSSNMPFWDKSLDAVILTHPDADHITGIVDVIKRYKVNALFTQSRPSKTQIYKLLLDVLAEKKLSAKYVKTGDRLKISNEVELKIIWPASEASSQIYQKGSNTRLNEYSVITLLRFGNFSAIFTGDAGSRVMDQIARNLKNIDILKVPHHGSKTGMNDHFLEVIKPELAVISVGAKNRYKHPSEYSLDLLAKHKIKILRTDLSGEIEIISDGKSWSVVE